MSDEPTESPPTESPSADPRSSEPLSDPRSSEPPLSDSQPSERLSPKIFRWLTVASSLVVVGSYLVPWADVVGDTAPAGATGTARLVALTNGPESESISALQIASLPEVTVGFALIALLVALLRWNEVGQVLSGVLGALAAGVVLYLLTFVGTDDGTEWIELGGQVGPANSFEPAVGLWIALLGSLAVVVCGFGAAVGEYVHRTASGPSD